jgi:hypothetical protein
MLAAAEAAAAAPCDVIVEMLSPLSLLGVGEQWKLL